MAYHWFWDLLHLLRENHASRTNPVISKPISVDTFPPGPISTLAQGFLAWPEQSTKVTLQKYWEAASMLHPGSSGDSCLPILHGKGYSEPSLGINTRDRGVFEEEWQASPRAGCGRDWHFQRRRSVLWLLPAVPGVAGDKLLVVSLGDERLRRQKGPSEHQRHNTKAAVQSPQFPS